MLCKYPEMQQRPVPLPSPLWPPRWSEVDMQKTQKGQLLKVATDTLVVFGMPREAVPKFL